MAVPPELERIVLDVIKEKGCRLYHAELKGNRLEVYIQKQGGASVGDCEAVSKNLALNLKTARDAWRELMLDVSTPGIERRLYSAEHYRNALGQNVEIKGKDGLFEGNLKEVDEDGVLIESHSGVGRRISYNEILSAQVKLTTEELFKRR
jgi:ribosome maturation factor RimP